MVKEEAGKERGAREHSRDKVRGPQFSVLQLIKSPPLPPHTFAGLQGGGRTPEGERERIVYKN